MFWLEVWQDQESLTLASYFLIQYFNLVKYLKPWFWTQEWKENVVKVEHKLFYLSLKVQGKVWRTFFRPMFKYLLV